jgi:hypothetical protein
MADRGFDASPSPRPGESVKRELSIAERGPVAENLKKMFLAKISVVTEIPLPELEERMRQPEGFEELRDNNTDVWRFSGREETGELHLVLQRIAFPDQRRREIFKNQAKNLAGEIWHEEAIITVPEGEMSGGTPYFSYHSRDYHKEERPKDFRKERPKEGRIDYLPYENTPEVAGKIQGLVRCLNFFNTYEYLNN